MKKTQPSASFIPRPYRSFRLTQPVKWRYKKLSRGVYIDFEQRRELWWHRELIPNPKPLRDLCALRTEFLPIFMLDTTSKMAL